MSCPSHQTDYPARAIARTIYLNWLSASEQSLRGRPTPDLGAPEPKVQRERKSANAIRDTI